MLSVEIRHRVIGGRSNEAQLPDVVLELLNEETTTAELIQRGVEEQIRDLILHHKLDVEKARQALDRHYLSDAQVRQQAQTGAIRYPSNKISELPEIDLAVEVQKAITAFENQTYMIVVDGQQVEGLDEVLKLEPTSKITFLRLTPLRGG
ncbi:MAG: hypothetical protein BroJett018_16930 [Chloroflexota bacterium]|nr:hypothetical protein [Chloroflexota bacterium]NOG66089.1 hypothetical protein [Chloroflexota bacterium]GIK63899.1 MAG: hypothetical protein BroJett018_16930 [Chloroflexota bacterium]